jgi:hypothetical protein
MQRPFLITGIFAVLMSLGVSPGASAPSSDELRQLAEAAVSEDQETAGDAARQLRAAGPAGLDALLTTHAALFNSHGDPFALSISCSLVIPSADDGPKWERLQLALDTVGGQKDCRTSRLYWYTDLEQAKSAARETKRPILSLRLLGKLTDEYSCANSRFFRTALYANREVSRALREQFVLHWASERPVPKVTIDFGDGRRLERTITGNSIHYLLDADGRPLDALPGLYGPKAFLRWLTPFAQVVRQLESASDLDRQTALVRFHRDRVAAIDKAWRNDLDELGIPVAESAPAAAGGQRGNVAVAAQRRAMTKSIVEIPVLAAISPNPSEVLTSATTDEVWKRIAERHKEDAALDHASIALLRGQHTAHGKGATAAEPLAVANSALQPDDALAPMIRNFENAIALDTVRNEYVMHWQLHAWFAAGAVSDLAALNERVYAELFLTPASDPWLGLYPQDAYTGLVNNGVVE